MIMIRLGLLIIIRLSRKLGQLKILVDKGITTKEINSIVLTIKGRIEGIMISTRIKIKDKDRDRVNMKIIKIKILIDKIEEIMIDKVGDMMIGRIGSIMIDKVEGMMIDRIIKI